MVGRHTTARVPQDPGSVIRAFPRATALFYGVTFDQGRIAEMPTTLAFHFTG
jgi:hypothetical protein